MNWWWWAHGAWVPVSWGVPPLSLPLQSLGCSQPIQWLMHHWTHRLLPSLQLVNWLLQWQDHAYNWYVWRASTSILGVYVEHLWPYAKDICTHARLSANFPSNWKNVSLLTYMLMNNWLSTMPVHRGYYLVWTSIPGIWVTPSGYLWTTLKMPSSVTSSECKP